MVLRGALQQAVRVARDERREHRGVVGVQPACSRRRSASETLAIGRYDSVRFHAAPTIAVNRRIPAGSSSAKWNRRLSRW